MNDVLLLLGHSCASSGLCAMSDQKKWYKSYCAKLLDPDYCNLDCRDAGRLDRLMCYMASAGNRGTLWVRHPAKNFLMHLEFESLGTAQKELAKLPNVCIKTPKNTPQKRNDNFSVTVLNWHKFQVDSTGSRRAKRHRVEEKRREEKRREETPNPHSFSKSTAQNGGQPQGSKKPLAGPYGG
jgi:hypothetical protein